MLRGFPGDILKGSQVLCVGFI